MRGRGRGEAEAETMTRKHFKAIAGMLNISRYHFASDNDYAQFCIYMGKLLRGFNSRFDMNRFLEACHAKPSPILQKELF